MMDNEQPPTPQTPPPLKKEVSQPPPIAEARERLRRVRWFHISLPQILTIVAILVLALSIYKVPFPEAPEPLDYHDMISYFTMTGLGQDHAFLKQANLEHRILIFGSDMNSYAVQNLTSGLLYLNAQSTTEPIHLYIRTEGGWYDDAFAIVDVMGHVEAPIYTYAMGGTHSSGAIILAAGDKRFALPHAMIMVHDNIVIEEYREAGSWDGINSPRLIQYWKERAQLPSHWFTEDVNISRYLNADEALGYGIIDVILGEQAPEDVSSESDE